MIISCETCKTEFKRRRKSSRFCGYSCAAKAPRNRARASQRMKQRNAQQWGENNPNWRGGKSFKARLLTKSARYKQWRKAVLKRDSYKCVWCGSTENLEADHVKSKALYPELIFDVTNGRTLCNPCHRKTPTYGVNRRFACA